MGVTCHKCAAPFGGGAQKYTKCQTCGIYYHVTDCGARYAGRPEIDTPLEACPKVRVRQIDSTYLSAASSTRKSTKFSEKRKTHRSRAAFSDPRRPRSRSLRTPRSATGCACAPAVLRCATWRDCASVAKRPRRRASTREAWACPAAPRARERRSARSARNRVPGLGAFGDVGGAAGRGFPGTAGGGASFEHAYARGVRRSGSAAFAGLGDLGGLGGLGGFDPDAANAPRRLAPTNAPRSVASRAVGIVDELVTLDERLRRENTKWQNVIALLARQLEREETCAACQASRSAAAADARSAANPAANGRGASLADAEARAAAGTRVASLLGGARDASAGPPNPLDAALHGLGRAGAGAGMAEVPAEFPAAAGGEAGGGAQSPDV